MLNNYYVRRVLHACIVFFCALTLTFALYRLLPFGPLEILRIQLVNELARTGGLTQAAIKQINRQIAAYTGITPNKPLYIQYLNYIYNVVVQQDLGWSIYHNQPVWPLMLRRMQWSLFISVYGLAFGMTAGLLLGLVMATREGTKLDKYLTGITIFNQTVPYYVVAIFLIIIFTYQLGWLPASGLENPDTTRGFNIDYMIGIARHAALPILSTFVAGFGGALEFRGNSIRELGKEYIHAAHLRGIEDTRISIRYVGRNSLLPIYTQLMLGIAALLGSSIILEIIFNYPGMGMLTYNALLNRDYPVLMGAFILYTSLTLLGILIADFTYGIIDPRVKGGDDRESF